MPMIVACAAYLFGFFMGFWGWVLSLLSAMTMIKRCPRLVLMYVLCCSAGFIVSYYEHLSHWQIPVSSINQNRVVEGVVVSIPNQTAFGRNFLLQMDQFQQTSLSALLRVNLYNSNMPVNVGERWRFTLRIKPPHGLQNPGGFNYQQWLEQEGIQATASVVVQLPMQRLAIHQCCTVTRWRQQIMQKIEASVPDPTLSAILNALTVGSRATVTPQVWQIFQRTGTNHLIVIAGLHLGFVAMIVYFISNRLWRLSARLLQHYPAQQFGSIMAMIAAILYAVLAGISVPTQRAVIMVSALTIAQLFFWQMTLWRRLLLAFVVVLILQPYALYSSSFWLSFLAVSWIGYGVFGRLKNLRGWRHGLRMQWVIFLGLLPVTLFFFHQISLVMLVANAFSIPWIGFLIVPLCLLAVMGSCFSSMLGKSLFILAADCLWPLWQGLQWLGEIPSAVWSHPLYEIWLLILTLLGIALLLAPRGLPGRWLGFMWILPLVFWRPPTPSYGQAWFTLLDVGQGLASVVETQHHVLIYDAGPSYPSGFDAGADVVLPFLFYRRISAVDKMVISHGDNDHIGGARAILQQFPRIEILTSVPERFLPRGVLRCQPGQNWIWDGVRFEMLYPPSDPQGNWQGKSNDGSCVLRITVGQQHLLLVGDIEKPAEQWLLQHESVALPASILVVPHHGSITSSTESFVASVKPEYALFGLGFYNRFHFPNPKVVQRYRNSGAKILTTADSGAISVRLSPEAKVTLGPNLRP